MNEPIVVTLPHKLGRVEARQRIAGGVGKLADFIPGGGAQVTSHWEGDRLHLEIKALGQSVTGKIDVEDSQVRLEMLLPPMMALFANKFRALLGKKGTEMLEDKSKA